jgi:hypothetical protein
MATNGNGKLLTVKGKVVDQSGNGIEGLEIRSVLTSPTCDGQSDQDQPTVCTQSDGCYELPVSLEGADATLSVMYPRKHEQCDGGVLVLKRGYLVNVEACEGTITISDRCYESTACMLSGIVEREAVDCDGRRPEYEPFNGATIHLLDQKGKHLGTASTDPAGQFSMTMPKEGPLHLRFQPELTEDGQSWRLEAPEREVHATGGRPFLLADRVRYDLCRARITGVVTDGKCGLAGVSVKLIHHKAEQCCDATTDADGCYRFDKVAPGSVRLIFRAGFCDAEQKGWELVEPAQAVQTHEVKAGELIHATPVKYGPELHTIECDVTLPNGAAAANRVVRVLDEDGKEVKVTTTDANGKACIDVGRRGKFRVTVYADTSSAAVPYSEVVSVNSPAHFKAIVAEEVSLAARAAEAVEKTLGELTAAAGSQLGAVGEAVIDSSSYPVLTEPVSFPYPTGGGAGGSTPGGGAGRGAALGPMVEGAIREVLGWRPKSGDPKGFVAALTQSFDCLAIEGHTECKWNERSYAAQVTTDMGAVTGAQASIYARAKVAIDQSIPLVQGLYPLSPTILQEDIDSVRSLVVRELNLLGAELGIVGGPRVQRVDELFELLLGVRPGTLHIDRAEVRNPDLVKGHVGELGRRLWLRRPFINTIQDEQNYTNFLIVVDYIDGLKQSWETYRPYFARSPGAEPFFGTQLVLMSRALTAIGEAVDEVSFAMDSVFLGPAERQTIELQFRDRQVAIPWLPGSPPDKKPTAGPADMCTHSTATRHRCSSPSCSIGRRRCRRSRPRCWTTRARTG